MLVEKLRNCFDEMTVYKNLRKTNIFSTLSLPAFMRDWLLKKFEDEQGEFDLDKLIRFVNKYIPRQENWNAIKNDLIIEGKTVKFLAKISININIQTGRIAFALPEFGLGFHDTLIEPNVWDDCKNDLIKCDTTWGMVELVYRDTDYLSYLFSTSTVNKREALKGKIALLSFKNFCPYEIDLDYYKEARKQFTLQEWLQVILGGVDYCADGFQSEREQLALLTRLLPFVEKRLNLIELAPKGTGKSTIFGRVSRYGWLSTGGTITRAKMFYDISKRKEGLVAKNDFVVLDEVQTIAFGNENEMRAALKGYLEQGNYTVGDYSGIADAGVVLCGNIQIETMAGNGFTNMFAELPTVFHESALIERFHGFLKGWDIPRMHDDLKMNGWALNSEYFSSIMHQLRDDVVYQNIVNEYIVEPPCADTRDTNAIKRIATAYLKLLFPHVNDTDDIDPKDFYHYCFKRAVNMRSIIKYQLGLLDTEYRGKDLPEYKVKGLHI